MSNSAFVFHGGRPLPSNLYSYSDRPLADPDPAPTAVGADGNITAGNAHIVWGSDGDGETATATITNNENQVVGQVAVDNKHNTVSVTKYDTATGKPDIDPATNKPVSSTFRYDDEGNLINDGNLSSEYLAHLPLTIDEQHNQLVTLQEGDSNTLPISVDIAPDLTSKTQHQLSAMVTMTARPSSNPDDKVDMLLIRGGGEDQDGAKVDPRQLTAQYIPQGSGSVTYVSPAPAVDHSWIHEWFPGFL